MGDASRTFDRIQLATWNIRVNGHDSPVRHNDPHCLSVASRLPCCCITCEKSRFIRFAIQGTEVVEFYKGKALESLSSQRKGDSILGYSRFKQCMCGNDVSKGGGHLDVNVFQQYTPNECMGARDACVKFFKERDDEL